MRGSPGAFVDAYPLTGYQVAAVLAGAGLDGPAVRLEIELPAPEQDLPVDEVERVVGVAIAEVTALFPPLRTRIDLADGVRQTVARAAPDGVRTTVRGLPGGACAVTLDFGGPVIDPVSGAILAAELRARYEWLLAGGVSEPVVPRPDTREAVAAQAPPTGAELPAGTPLFPVTGAPDPGEARWDLSEGSCRELARLAVDWNLPLSILLLTVHLRVLGLLTGRAVVDTWVVEDGRAVAGVGPEAVGEFRLVRPVSVDRDVETWARLAERVAADRAQPVPRVLSSADLRRAGEAGGSVFEFRDLPPDGFADHPLATLSVRIHATDGQPGLSVLITGDAQAAGSVLGYWRQAVAELTADPFADPRGGVAPGEPAPPPTTPAAESVHGLIRTMATAHPDAVAVLDDAGQLTYRELRVRADAVAARLAADGIGPENVVGVYLPRSVDLVVALVGVLTAGAAFVALDVDYPLRRSADALADAGADVLLTRSEVSVLPESDVPVLFLDSPGTGESARPPAPTMSQSVAYVLFTSGSTGRPKGVAVPHSALVNLARWSARSLGLGPGDRVAQRTPVAFDAGIWEIFAPLACGATLVVLPTAASREAAVLEEAVNRHSITVLQLVPSLLAAHVEAGTFARTPGPRLVLCGGEALPQALATAFARQSTATLVNVYGPTECAVDATWWISDPEAEGDTVPIGTAVDGLTLQVLGEFGEPLPPGVPGELYLGGAQVAAGYRGRPGATAERFLPDPFAGRPGARFYRTGDRGRRLPGGEVEYLGRLDRQVKIRGVRIELGEIEAALAALPLVAEAVVAVRADAGGGAELLAYVVPTEPVDDLAGVLRARLRERLPDSMLPARFVPLAALPLLPNGKVDHGGLPAPAGATAVAPYRAPADAVEEELADLCAELFGVDAVGRNDSLTALGMDRLLAFRAAARIGRRHGRAVHPGAVLSAPTVAHLASMVQSMKESA